MRENPWLYERDGDLNPTWILVVLYAALGVIVSIAAVLSRSPYAFIATLSFLGAMIVALLISALPRDRAKILANSRAVGDTARGIARARPYGDSTEDFDVDEYLPDPR